MDGYVGNTVNDSAFSRRWVPSDLRGPAHADVHGATPASASGDSFTDRYNAMIDDREPAEAPQEPRSGGLGMDLSLAAGNVVALCLERNAKYGNSNIAHTPGGALNGIIVRLYDKLARLAHSKENFRDESVQDTLEDVVGYGLIAILVHNKKWPGTENG